MTPHLGEFSRLTSYTTKEILSNRIELSRGFTKKYGVNLVLKSETTISVNYNGEVFINLTGNEILASAGSGDVLAGIISSMLVQTGSTVKAMILGNYIHGLCAELCFQKSGNKQSSSPKDIIRLIPEAISLLLSNKTA
jgi:NAD(P)H-hydrate epimerase